MTDHDFCRHGSLVRAVRARRSGRELFDETLARLHYLTRNQIERAWILFQQRAPAGWSFTDCTSKIVIDDLGVNTAATLDQHFAQFGVGLAPESGCRELEGIKEYFA